VGLLPDGLEAGSYIDVDDEQSISSKRSKISHKSASLEVQDLRSYSVFEFNSIKPHGRNG